MSVYQESDFRQNLDILRKTPTTNDLRLYPAYEASEPYEEKAVRKGNFVDIAIAVTEYYNIPTGKAFNQIVTAAELGYSLAKRNWFWHGKL